MSKQFVCTSMLPLGHLVPQFDVSFPEKLLKIVATGWTENAAPEKEGPKKEQ